MKPLSYLSNFFRFKTVNNHQNLLILFGSVLFILPIIAYIPATYCDFIWDDDVIVVFNNLLRSFEGLQKVWFQPGVTLQYYPMVHTVYWIGFHLWDLNPAGYHLVNIVLHAVNAVLLWVVLRQLSVPGSWLAAAIFAVHPVHVESVAWISELKNVLSGFFYLASLFFAIRFWIQQNKFKNKQVRDYVVSLILFVCAMHSKTVTCSLPIIILLIIYWKRGKINLWKDVYPLTPFFIIGFVMGLLTIFLEKETVGARGAIWDFSLLQKMVIAGKALWFYLEKLMWPSNLMFIYPRWNIDNIQTKDLLIPFLFIIFIGALWLWRKKLGKGVLVAFLYFVVTLIPALGFFNVYPMRFSFVADHFQYLASIGPITVLAACIFKVFGEPQFRLVGKNAIQGLFIIFPAALLVCFGCLVWRQCAIYKNQETLWAHILSKDPNSSIAHTNYASVLLAYGHPGQAGEYYARLLEFESDNEVANYNLGQLFEKSDLAEEAIIYLKRAFSVSYDDNNRSIILNALGMALMRQGKTEEAISHFLEALRLKPSNGYAAENLAQALKIKKQNNKHAFTYPEIFQLNPKHLVVKQT